MKMMKSYRINILFSLVAILGFSCADENLKPILTVDQLTIGAYPKVTNLINGEYDLNNPTTTVYSYEIEFITEDGGQNVETYTVSVKENGSDLQLYRTYTQADFGTSSESGNRTLSVSIPLSDVAELFGKTATTVPALTTYRFEKVITLTDGRVFGYENSSPTVRGPGFAGDFRLDVLVTCPMTSDQFSGSYRATYDSGREPSVGPAFELGDPTDPNYKPVDLEIETVAGSTTKRKFTHEWGFGGFETTVSFNMVCFIVVASDATVPGTCSGPNIVVGAGPDEPFDYNDDSSFILNLVDWEQDGGCGVSPDPFSILFTKN